MDVDRRPPCGLLSLEAGPLALPATDRFEMEPDQLFVKKSSAPLRTRLQKRSSRDFLTVLHDQIVDMGLGRGDAFVLLDALVNAPTLQFHCRRSGRVLHAGTFISRGTSLFAYLSCS